VRLDDALLTEAKKWAADHGRSLTAVIEDALRETLSRKKPIASGKRQNYFPDVQRPRTPGPARI